MTTAHDDPPYDRSNDRTLSTVVAQRRRLLQAGLGVAMTSIFGLPLALRPRRILAAQATGASSLLGLTGIPVSRDDAVHVPPGYSARVLYAWGDPVSTGPAFKPDAGNTAAKQAQQAGMHHDGMWFFPCRQLAQRTRATRLRVAS